MSLHVNWGPPMEEVHREPVGVRWCFVCRNRRPFDFVVKAPMEPSYYGPSPFIVDERGHVDGDLFPGRIREWEEPAMTDYPDAETFLMLLTDIALGTARVLDRLLEREGHADLSAELDALRNRVVEVIDLEQAMKGKTE